MPGKSSPASTKKNPPASKKNASEGILDTDRYYPAFLNLRGKNVVIVGGGRVAERKMLSLMNTGANITVISPEITRRILREKQGGKIRLIKRPFRKGDLINVFLVISATDSSAINKEVSREAPGLVNVVDVPALCNFIVPSVIRRGALNIAISTSGISPAMSKTIRGEIQKQYGPVFAGYLNLLKDIRKTALKEIPDVRKRMAFLKGLASREKLGMLREKGIRAVRDSLTSKSLD
jgi:precorrin-2 dehydrogenase/sirohydrochlorin ferrochelatase